MPMPAEPPQHDDALADLRAMRQALEARKAELQQSLRGSFNPYELAALHKEILALRELCMAIGANLWTQIHPGEESGKDEASRP
jgi:hypothetical protein